MNDLEAVARDLRLSVDTLKLPAELLKQGYDPSFLSTYRPDELGQLETATLARLQRGLQQRARLSSYKEKLCIQGEAEGWWQSSLNAVVDGAESVAEVDGLTRNIRSRKSSRILAEKDPRLAQLGQAILTLTGEAPADMVAWIGEQFSTNAQESQKLLTETKTWLQVLLSEDAQLLHRLGRQILRRGQLSIKLLAEQTERDSKGKPDGDHPTAEHLVEDDSLSASYATIEAPSHEDSAIVDESADSTNLIEEPKEATEAVVASSDASLANTELANTELATNAEGLATDAKPASAPQENGPAESENTPTVTEEIPTEPAAVESATTELSSAASPSAIDPLLAAFSNTPASKTKSNKLVKKPVTKAPLKQLSPRQRRRKWLRSILQRYSKLRIPLQRIGHYQALMLGRGQRSQIVSIKIDYDRQPMTQMARESLCPGPHPLNSLLMEVSEEALQKIILPRLEHDVFSELEEAAHHELTEMAVRHLQDMLQQRPVRGHRILVIDAMGPKTAAVAIVDPNGRVDFTGELSAVSSRADVVAQNVATLGQWIHQYRVTLVAVSNGNTRRYLIHTVNELMKQSGEGGLRWTIVDRTGADAYCDTRQALHELPKIAKRFRAAVWLAWRLQDPLIELTKVDPARLRLGSYQRELPQDTLEAALLQAVSTSVAARGIDVWHSHEKALICLPGVTPALARAITALRDDYQLSTREKMLESLRELATENQLKQAIGYLRLFGSSQPLDATIVHPDDYRLAERLVAAGPLTSPPAAPEGWQRPTRPGEVAAAVASDQPQASEEALATGEESNAAPADSPDSPSETTSDSATLETPIELSAATPSVVEVVADSEASASENSASENSAPYASAASDEIIGFSPAESSAAEALPAAALPVKPSAPAIELAPTNPQNPTESELAPPLTIDVERLARSWQVGREKMRVVARSLQQPFADSRDARVPIPLLSHVPTIETLRPGLAAWGIVIGVADFGAFVDLGPDCNGLIHVSRLSREFVEDPHEIVQIGDLLQVWVLNVDHAKKRVALSALPPGTEIARRPSSHDDSRETSSNANSNRGFAANRPTASRPGQASQDNRSSGQGQRGQGQGGQGQRGQGQSAGQSAGQGPRGQGQGQQRGPGNQGSGQQGSGQQGSGQRGSNQRGQGRDRYERRDEGAKSNDSASNRPRSKPAQPAPPITDAMQDGREPLRSFSDLMQFFQTKRDEPSKTSPPPSVPPPTAPPTLTPAPTESTIEETDAKPNA